MASKKKERFCQNGHRYFKSSDCPVCPICEKLKMPEAEFLQVISAPARRALEGAGMITLEALANCTEKELLKLHGFGPSAIPKLKDVLKKHGLTFSSE